MPGTASLPVDHGLYDAASPPALADRLDRARADGPGAGMPVRDMANAARLLALDAVQHAGGGDPRMACDMADAATVLWSRFLKFDAADPRWPDRDRFVLSAGQGAILLYALLHLTGHAGMGMEELQRYRQLHAPASGHPELGTHPAIEATTGPLGQGFATAVGMALAERLLAARFGRSLVDHRTWVLACRADLAQGVSHEAAGLAGELRLDRLAVLYHERQPPSGADDPLRRFAACGWAVQRVDATDLGQVTAALASAMRARKPSLIACHTNGEGRGDGACLADGDAGAAAARDEWGWPGAEFTLPHQPVARWQAAGARGAAPRRAWLKRLARHPLRAEFERVMAGRLPDGFHETMAHLKASMAETRAEEAPRHASHRAMEALGAVVPELVGGSVDDAAAGGGRGMGPIACGSFAGRFVHYGMREHAMAAAASGMALHGGLLPCAESRLVFSDYMRPALRLAALMHQRVVHVLAEDGASDGPAHQAVEQLAGLRATPNLFVFRPGDALEAVECWELALRRTDGPSLLVLSGRKLPRLRADLPENRCARGGYVLQEADGPRQATLIATGAEVSAAVAARALLAEAEITVAVVSLPCWEAFCQQDEAWRAAVLGQAPRIGIEAGSGFGWERWLGPDGVFLGLTGFGACGPQADLARHFGLTAEAIVAAVRRRLG